MMGLPDDGDPPVRPSMASVRPRLVSAQVRWQRNARVQGPMRLGWDLSLKLPEARLLDMPRLYG
jgi:hypothetical protein